MPQRSNCFLSSFILFVCMISMAYAIDPPSDIDVTFDADRNKIDIIANIPGGLGSDDSCHAILVSDLSTSLSGAYEIGSALPQSDGPAISFAAKNSTLAVFLGNQAIERYFVAVKVSRLVNGNRIHSPWKIHADNSTGLPISISTSHGIYKENIFHRARCIDERNSHKIIIDFTFSLPTTNASGCKFKLFKNNTELLNVDNLGTVSGKSDIQNAMQDTAGINSALILKRENNGSYFYNIYQTVNITPADTISATIISSDGSVIDTVHEKVRIFSDSSYMNIVSTISALTYMADGTSDPFYPAPFQPMADSVKANLLIAAMIDQSLAHNSPKPSNTELAQGIYTNYMQFMDNIARNWSSVGAAGRGIQRLRSIHNLVLGQNKSGIVDPVAVENKGTCFEPNAGNAKRKNYIFFNAFSRLNWRLDRPIYTGIKTGIGVMFHASDNVDLYTMRYEGTAIVFDTIPFLDGSLENRIIYRTDKPLLDTLTKDSGGVWVLGSEDAVTKTFFIGVEPIRLPIATIHNGTKIDTAFTLGTEGKSRNDVEGKIIEDGEKSLYKIEPNIDGNKTLENAEEGNLFIHGQKRKVVYNTDYKEPSSFIDFKLFGDSANTGKVLIEDRTPNSAVLHDTSQFDFKSVGVFFIEKFQNLAVRIGRIFLGSYKVAIKDANNGKLSVVQYLPKKMKGYFVTPPAKAVVNIENDPANLIPLSKRNNKYLKVRWSSSKISATDNSGSILFPDLMNKFGAAEEDRSPLHINVRNWEKVNDYLYSHPFIEITSEEQGTFYLDFSLNGDRSSGEYLKETVEINAVNVSFDSAYNQKYGFDEEVFDEQEYISLDKNGYTYIKVSINPFKAGMYWIKSSNTGIFDVSNGPLQLNTPVTYLRLDGKGHVSDFVQCQLQVTVESANGPVLKSIPVIIAKNREVNT